jgi:hypothetical protein
MMVEGGLKVQRRLGFGIRESKERMEEAGYFEAIW